MRGGLHGPRNECLRAARPARGGRHDRRTLLLLAWAPFPTTRVVIPSAVATPLNHRCAVRARPRFVHTVFLKRPAGLAPLRVRTSHVGHDDNAMPHAVRLSRVWLIAVFPRHRVPSWPSFEVLTADDSSAGATVSATSVRGRCRPRLRPDLVSDLFFRQRQATHGPAYRGSERLRP